MRFASPLCRTPRENMIQTATAAHRRYPSPPPAATLHGKTHGFVLGLPPHAAIAHTHTMRFAAPRAHPCSHYNAICIHTLQNTKGEPITLETIQTATAHTRYPSSPPAATLHGKTHAFVLRLPLQPHYNAFCSTMYTPCSHYNAIRIPAVQNTKGEPITR